MSLRRPAIECNNEPLVYKDVEFSNRQTRCAVSIYLLDHLMEPKRVEFLEEMYGGKCLAHMSAKIIQKCFRNYMLLKKSKENDLNLPISLTRTSVSNNDADFTDLKNSNESTDTMSSISSKTSTITLSSVTSIDSLNSSYDPDDPFSILNDKDRKWIYFLGKNLFNRNCNKGINFLIKHGILEADGSSIVKFFSSQGLSSFAKGDFMSQDNNVLAIAARKEFLSKMSFYNCSIESGVRQLFSKIRIPGETQKILNMLEEFHKIYLFQNPDIRKALKKEDTVVLISFAILMVHTSLYNPSASKQDKMSKEHFIKIFNRINDEDFINESYLTELYDNIKKKQMKPLSDHTDMVRNVFNHLRGPLLPKDLIQNHRKLICKYNCNEVPNINKRPNSHSHFRELFLFNDLLLITKSIRSSSEFQVRHSIPLSNLKLSPFHTEYYAIGVEIIQPTIKKKVVYLDCISSNNRDKLMSDIMIYIEEVKHLDLLSAGEIDKFIPLNKHDLEA